MGLDMYAKKVKVNDGIELPEVDAELFDANGDPITKENEEIHYWRKHHDLFGWFSALYQKKGGKDAEFNVSTVELTNQDLTDLEYDLMASKLPKTEGFFFGNNPPDEESLKEDLGFIEKAREAIREGYRVYFYGWY